MCDSSDVSEISPSQITDVAQVSFSYMFKPEHQRTFRIVRCRRCSHVFCDPVPETIGRHYQDVVDEEYLRHDESRRLAAREVLRVIQTHVPGGVLLDVGCATGDLLDVARGVGYRAEGVELSRWSADIARKRGLVVHEEVLARLAERCPASFDVVSLMGVIEHFANPRAEMANIAALLKPGGLVAIWTGDVSSYLSRVLGRKWWYWQGQHVQYFTHKSLERLAADAGLAHVETQRYPFAATHRTLSNSLRRYRFHRVFSAALLPLFKVRPVIYLRLPGEMLFLARKRA